MTYVMDNDDFARAQELLRDDYAAQSVADTSACVAYDVGITFFEPEGSENI